MEETLLLIGLIAFTIIGSSVSFWYVGWAVISAAPINYRRAIEKKRYEHLYYNAVLGGLSKTALSTYDDTLKHMQEQPSPYLYNDLHAVLGKGIIELLNYAIETDRIYTSIVRFNKDNSLRTISNEERKLHAERQQVYQEHMIRVRSTVERMSELYIALVTMTNATTTHTFESDMQGLILKFNNIADDVITKGAC